MSSRASLAFQLFALLFRRAVNDCSRPCATSTHPRSGSFSFSDSYPVGESPAQRLPAANPVISESFPMILRSLCGTLRAGSVAVLVHLAESGDSVPRWVSRKCNMVPKSALLRLWRGSRGSIRYAKALLASKGRETHAGSQGSID